MSKYCDLTVSTRKLDNKKIYYVYAHYRPNDTIPFYIGKGTGPRSHVKERNNPFWSRVATKHGGFDVKLLYDNINEYDAYCLEIFLIWAYGRRNIGKGPLTNLTDGGEGPTGGKWKQRPRRKEHKEALSKGVKEFWDSLSSNERSKHAGKRTVETRDLQSIRALQRVGITCPVCGFFGKANMKKCHFDNCKGAPTKKILQSREQHKNNPRSRRQNGEGL